MSTTTPTSADATTEGRPGRRADRRRRAEGTSGQGRATLPVKLAVLFVGLLWTLPTLGTLITSFRPKDDANSSGWWTVFTNPTGLSHLSFNSYRDVIDQADLGTAFVNSFAIALPATFIPILIAAFAAYAFTFMHFPGRDFLFFLIVALLVVPNYVAFVPILQLYGKLHLTGTFPAVWLAHIGFGMSLAIFLFRNYMSTLPKEVIESAKIDGASHHATFWRLIVPMSVPALASFAILQFVWVWNDLLVALIFIGPGDNQPMTVAVKGLIGQQGQGWQVVTSGGFFSMIIPLLVFLSMQRFFVRGLTAGSVKG